MSADYEQKRDEVLAVFSTKSDSNSITLTWTNKDVIAEAKQAIDQLVQDEVRKARINEVVRMPNTGYLGSDGIRREPNEQYKINRVLELTNKSNREK